MFRALVMAGLVLSMPPRDLLRLSQADVGRGPPPGWQLRPVKGEMAPELEVRDAGGHRVLRISGAGRAAWIYRDLRQEQLEPGSTLRWTWRVLDAPEATDLQIKQADDSPIRVYVVFGNPRALFGGSGRIIFYSFGNDEPDGYAATSHVSSRIHIVRVDGSRERGIWREHAAEPGADYRRIWQRTPPAITAIGVMQDTDQTGGHAVAELRRLDLAGPPMAAAEPR